VFTVYPSFRTYLESLDDGAATLESWIRILALCDEEDVQGVVDEICDGLREPVSKFQKPDQLPFNLRAEACDRRAKRTKATEQDEKYHQPIRSKANQWLRQQRTGRIAIQLGVLVREGKLTREENDRRMDELLEWDKGRLTAPAWLEAMQ